ncbi:MurR/RpiR family transcriptional regulator [Pikeienuella piscinae]|uniref:MurR/RpiR family transcriptional regulator n=1 Tax=Pikeienuella piscinae TaxID=2748098 RepID=A0A7L5C2A0_9RHOB|nr:MurR/RpiR family transcriptional regulator [Pikeienuella piscinae]QIE55999.1 MurR/RpiR family transcriptional regulator [Pikeienuella piscinae]
MTVKDILRRNLPDLTAGQSKLAAALLADYPFAALHPIQHLADATGLSPPSISRFVHRLGFGGFAEFQQALIAELREGGRSPRDLRVTADDASSANFLATYSDRFSSVSGKLSGIVPQQQIDSVTALLADPTREIYLRGGRISNGMAQFLSVHLRQIRPGVHHLADDPEMWPDALLQARRKDVLVLFDFRRYQPMIVRLAATARQHCRMQIILLTDRWQSPAARYCTHVIAVPIEIGTASDTMASVTTVLETLIVTVSEHDWRRTEKRMEKWDALLESLQNAEPTQDTTDRTEPS